MEKYLHEEECEEYSSIGNTDTDIDTDIFNRRANLVYIFSKSEIQNEDGFGSRIVRDGHSIEEIFEITEQQVKLSKFKKLAKKRKLENPS